MSLSQISPIQVFYNYFECDWELRSATRRRSLLKSNLAWELIGLEFVLIHTRLSLFALSFWAFKSHLTLDSALDSSTSQIRVFAEAYLSKQR